MGQECVLELTNIDKSFNRIPVLRSAHFELKHGEIHALVGGNGAGKSTLMKIVTGVYTKDAGEIRVFGQDVHFNTPGDAELHGIAMIFQEFSLIPTLTVAQNIFLGREPKNSLGMIKDRVCRAKAAEILKLLQVNIDPTATVDTLGVGYWQMVEIAKALSKNARILVMDEPTSSLSEAETSALFGLMRRLRESGISIIYISHRMSEIFEICDRVSVLKDGETVLTGSCSELTLEAVISAMLGTDAGEAFLWQERESHRVGEPVLEVHNLNYQGRVRNVSFDIYPGEIVGLAGLMGSGRTEIAECIFGIRRRDSGDVRVSGRKIRNTAAAIEAGAVLVPEDRRKQGLVLEHSVKDNLILPMVNHLTKGFFVDDSKGREMAEEAVAKLNIKTDSIQKMARLLSGGNQQKIVLGKWLTQKPKVMILDEPTIGVDIGAKSEIVTIIRNLADEGISFLVISSELPELLAVCDRLLILYDGSVIKEMRRKEIEKEEELQHAIQGY